MMSRKSKTSKPLFLPCLIAGVVVLWGSSFVLSKFALEEIGAVTLAFYRWCFATAFFLLFLGSRGQLGEARAMVKGDPGLFAFLGFVGISLFYTLQNLGLKYSTAINVGILININPLLIAILSAFILNERLNLTKALGIVVAFGGVCLITLNEGPIQLASRRLVGDLLTLLSALCWAIYSVWGKRALARHEPLLVTSMAASFGTIFLLPMALWEGMALPSSAQTWLLVALLGVLSGALAYLFWYAILERMDASRAAVYLFLIPAYSTALAILALNEPVTFKTVIGAILIISGVFAAQAGGKEPVR